MPHLPQEHVHYGVSRYDRLEWAEMIVMDAAMRIYHRAVREYSLGDTQNALDDAMAAGILTEARQHCRGTGAHDRARRYDL